MKKLHTLLHTIAHYCTQIQIQMLKLRGYQEESKKEILLQILKKIFRILLCAPTGAGKTIIFTDIAKGAYNKGNKILVLTHRGELLEQSGGSFAKFNIPHDWLKAETKQIPIEKVCIAMCETLYQRLKGKKSKDIKEWLHSFRIIIIDEAHYSHFDKLFPFFNPNSIVIGVTATPLRNGKMNPLSNYYETIVEKCTISQLIREGYLATAEYYGIPTDISTVKKQGGEFKISDLERVYSDKIIYSGLTRNYNRLFYGRKTLIFAPGIKSAMVVWEELKKECSEPLFYVDGEMPKNIRKQQLKEFANTYPAIMINVGVLTTGYDCPSIDTIILYRDTTSLPLYLQMCGRGGRITETKKTFRIIDFGNNVKRFGFWHDDRIWSLNNSKIPKEGVAPVKYCPFCEAIIPASAKICPYCKRILPIKTKKNNIIEVELQKITAVKPINVDKFNFKSTEKTYSVIELETIRVTNNYKTGFVLHRLKTLARFEEYAELRGYSKKWAYIQFKFLHK